MFYYLKINLFSIGFFFQKNKTCVQTLEGHSQNVGCVAFHPELPIVLSGSEDGTVKLWHSNTYRLESTLNYGLERCWAISCLKGSNNVALGYDEGTMMIKVNRFLEKLKSIKFNCNFSWVEKNQRCQWMHQLVK